MATKKKTNTGLAIPSSIAKGLQEVDGKTSYFDIPFDLVLEGDAADDSEPLILATQKILSSLSKEIQEELEGAKTGKFWNTLLMEPSDSLNVVPVYRYIERYYSLTPSQPGSPIVCASRDGRGQYGVCSANPSELGIPVVRIEDSQTKVIAPVGDCANCPLKEFSADKNGNRTKPKCREVHYVVCIDVDRFEFTDDTVEGLVGGDAEVVTDLITGLFAVPFSSTSLSTLKKIKNMNRLSGGAWFARQWEFSTRKATDGQNQWWTVDAKPMRGLNRDEKIVAKSVSKFVEKLRGFDRLHARLDAATVSPGVPEEAGEQSAVDID